MQYTYLLINLAIIIGPLAFTFHRKIKYYTQLLIVAKTTFFVSTTYICLDVFAHKIGFWDYSPLRTTAISIFDLPLGEVLFFITIPYSCLFVWVILKTHTKKVVHNHNYLFLFIQVLSLLLIVIGYTFGLGRYYLETLGLIILIVIAYKYNLIVLFRSRQYYLFLIFGFTVFLLFNYLLTSYPVVVYDDSFSSGIRLATIPLEDFFYNFSLLSTYIIVFEYIASKRINK